MSDEHPKPPTFDIHEELKRWSDTVRTVYYGVAILAIVLPAGYFAVALAFRHVVIPHWEWVSCLSTLAFLIAAFALHSNLIGQGSYRGTRRNLVCGMPTLFAYIAARAIIVLLKSPESPLVYYWQLILVLAMVFTVSTVFVAAVQICLSYVVEIYDDMKSSSVQINKIMGMVDKLIERVERLEVAPPTSTGEEPLLD
jgi:hypothetical protein